MSKKATSTDAHVLLRSSQSGFARSACVDTIARWGTVAVVASLLRYGRRTDADGHDESTVEKGNAECLPKKRAAMAGEPSVSCGHRRQQFLPVPASDSARPG